MFCFATIRRKCAVQHSDLKLKNGIVLILETLVIGGVMKVMLELEEMLIFKRSGLSIGRVQKNEGNNKMMEVDSGFLLAV